MNQNEDSLVTLVLFKFLEDKLKHTKISSVEISDGREYSLLFLYVKVEVSC
ncbi:hypothetical protein SMULJ23_0302 [Streptococcus mutans LJ23]|nr:hypothetical protein SMULJ23_0302 [Streptococcus mutans LJ23]